MYMVVLAENEYTPCMMHVVPEARNPKNELEDNFQN